MAEFIKANKDSILALLNLLFGIFKKLISKDEIAG